MYVRTYVCTYVCMYVVRMSPKISNLEVMQRAEKFVEYTVGHVSKSDGAGFFEILKFNF